MSATYIRITEHLGRCPKCQATACYELAGRGEKIYVDQLPGDEKLKQEVIHVITSCGYRWAPWILGYEKA